MADELSCHNVEHLPLCLHFVDEKCEIQEEFIRFLKLERVRAIDITDAIVNSLKGMGQSMIKLWAKSMTEHPL